MAIAVLYQKKINYGFVGVEVGPKQVGGGQIAVIRRAARVIARCRRYSTRGKRTKITAGE